ncbi:MAG: undecaprenyl/decaprenyl-phosphate alpha-N-acetylglucosaminyl 1-phosphate transferase [Firmicutes bacterium]|nr:undecaprenyl/decaprenyl-phosphate alpha-N-acetylglucosaminyl 1-phosphate transferase [Bacillota bacterium]
MERYLGPFICALVFAAVLTPLVRRLALALWIMDEPAERKVHERPVPLWGGLAIFLSFLFTAKIFASEFQAFGGIVVAGTLITVIGLIDDVRPLSAKTKFLGQILASLVLIALGTKIEFLTNPFGGMIYLGWWGIPLTVLWVVSITNMVNLIDGLDGLAAGVAAIASAALWVVAASKGQTTMALLSAVLAGGALGFLPYNFNPAKIFMGDTGSMFLGFMLAALSVEGALKGAATIALTIPLLVLGVPFFDTLFAIWRRYREGRPVYKADRGHLHHRLLDMGLSQKAAVLLVYAFSVALGITAIIVSQLGEAGSFLAVVSLGVFMYLLSEVMTTAVPVGKEKNHG